MIRGFLGWLVLMAALLPQLLSGATISVRTPDGSVNTQTGVVIQGITWTAPGQAATLSVQFANGQVLAADLRNVTSISFGTSGEGEAYNLQVNKDGVPTPFDGVTLFRYENGEFFAAPGGSAQQFAIPAPNMLSMTSASAPSAPAGGDIFGAPPAGGTDIFADPAPSGDAFADPSGAEESTGDDAAAAFRSAETDAKMSGIQGKLAAAMATLGVLVVLVFLVMFGPFFITWFWTMIHAFMNGQAGAGLTILVLCIVCWPAQMIPIAIIANFFPFMAVGMKTQYVKQHYNGSGKIFLQLLLGLEWLLVFVYALLNVMAGGLSSMATEG